MANYYTEASFIIPLNHEQQVFAMAVIDCISDEEINLLKKHKTVKAKTYPSDIYRVAKRLAKAIDDYEDFNSLGFRAVKESDGLWVSHDESINDEHAAVFTYHLLKHFDLDVAVSIETSHTCSKPRLDAFGGSAAFVTKKGIKWFGTQQWLAKQALTFNKNKQIKQGQ